LFFLWAPRNAITQSNEAIQLCGTLRMFQFRRHRTSLSPLFSLSLYLTIAATGEVLTLNFTAYKLFCVKASIDFLFHQIFFISMASLLFLSFFFFWLFRTTFVAFL
jgi:hypothetical protein